MNKSRPPETHRIPSRDGSESISIAARVRAHDDVVKAWATDAVQPRVEEAERFLAF